MKHFLKSTGIIVLLASNALFAQNQVTLSADLGKHTINRHIYGHFAEHLGKCIYGGFYVGENNTKIPNKDGVRMDVVNALKKMKIPNLRWPGGCFADTYQWKDGIGPKANRPKIVNVWWGNVTEDNSFGTHDFLNMCELIGTEPYLAGNVGSGTVKDLSDWVQYVNFKGVSPMSDLRAKNGRPEPWKVRYWGVGNEAWGCGGNMKPDYYANIYRQYATFMNASWENNESLFRIASGASDNDYQWTETLMREIPHKMLEGIAVHHYSVIDWKQKGPSTTFTEELYFKTMKEALLMDELITRHSTVMDKYDPVKKVALVVDEWGGWYDVEPGTNPGFLFQQNTMRDAVLAGATLNIFHKHCERVRMANLAQVVNVLQSVILTNEEKMILTPTYHVMEMYNVHQDATMLPVAVQSNDYVVGNEKLPAVSVSASRDKNGLTHVSLVNIDPNKPQEITVNLRGMKASGVTGRILTSAKVQDYNSFENPGKVQPASFNGANLNGEVLKVKLPPVSVVVLELK
ncbi:alpha-N-arabinofuranosidase [Runella slithyformis]|uniref:non-reducing end alpha-L-arabinofuranosidase n=1 Tax=Runella slithyformis (strain ATCC 29530 / DSM 19594 / LMG 11500 / NCIMB 11436 / LSU 4) TaxID=761193 RepID=A0A7U3ZM43_RUNSL|nr:alpha-L-arabinofuranosidase C-terminal domain-containing protein [Runella slithyformis]AEI49750.1 alpha-L-arabinofuranosidase domain protein [Runella slithyformis DSM 19594]